MSINHKILILKCENISDAIVRKIREELGCTIEFIDIFHNNTHEYENIIVNLITVKCKLVNGTPKASEHAKLIWLSKDYLEGLIWAPADVPTIEKLLHK